jgi:uncharacterized DUF497 family protein
LTLATGSAEPLKRASPTEGRASRLKSGRRDLNPEERLGRTVLVVFTERVARGTIRIISARRATKRERRAYVEGD